MVELFGKWTKRRIELEHQEYRRLFVCICIGENKNEYKYMTCIKEYVPARTPTDPYGMAEPEPAMGYIYTYTYPFPVDLCDTPGNESAKLPPLLQISPICSRPFPDISWERASPAPPEQQSLRRPRQHNYTSTSPPVPGLKRARTATIPSPPRSHSLAAILSPSAPPEDSAVASSRSSTPKRTYTEAFAPDPPYLHPASPTHNRASIATAGEPSPSTRGADDGSVGGMREGQEEKKPPKMVRSSIACSKCRRSKVKCINTGVGSTCKACATSNRDCEYPVAGATLAATPKRSDAHGGFKQEEGESKKRIRKVEDTGRRYSAKSGEDVLEDRVLTKKVWDDVYEIFKLHFSTEMPFLHPTTFRNRMRLAWQPKDPSVATTDNSDSNVLLLGVLTLTARFQPDLVERHSSSGDPTAASEYYATALASAFGPTIRGLTHPTLERIQALLMLGLYEWGQTRGLSAWVYVGIATRLAQSMGLPHVDDPSIRVLKGPLSNDSLRGSIVKKLPEPRELLTEKEVQRRTWWSCFIMDRMLSAGKCRPTMTEVEKLRVQLPCSDGQFLFQNTVHTGFLDTKWLEEAEQAERKAERDEIASDDNVLKWYIRLVEIFGRFSEWSYAGGRRTEKTPPWDEGTEFFQLRHELEHFKQALPSNLTFTDSNLSAHIEGRNATAYASMHTLYMLCLIMLHREYIPFIPLRTKTPAGPLDEPSFPPDKFDIPDKFWEESAETMFRAARDIIHIVKTCQENNALPESPQVGFAVWQAAFVCIYGNFFPDMDTGRHVQGPSYGADCTKLLSDLVPRLKMVKAYQTTARAMQTYFSRVLYEWKEHVLRKKPLRWRGGGLDKYLDHEKALKEFGTLSDTDRNNHSNHSEGSETTELPRSRASTNEIGSNGETMQGVEASRSTGQSWQPINGAGAHGASTATNAGSPSRDSDERSRYNYPYGAPHAGPTQPMAPYQHSPNQSTVPSLASPSNGDSSGLNSPYAIAQSHPHPTQMYNVAGHSPLAATYSAAQQQGMGPPSVQPEIPPEADPIVFLNYHNGIGGQPTGMDNFAQDSGFLVDKFGPENYYDDQSMDYMQVVHDYSSYPPPYSR
ncbi:putative transcriptional regulatory protein PB1A11.04c [Lachnellula suecica]|uniref:Putative transcriptional regulatory protein PB1A11.04c n=1 Tax=Lachnellula suecica TaxID=602035 RepID=A0A8T9BX90_9HELO|nr:putative transcriptional regulatory protein PB1A11.04c [Lachnellula suecica]